MSADERNPYDILGVARTATSEEIKAAYRKLAVLHHPDRNPGDKDAAHTRMKAINGAHDLLSDAVKRKAVDEALMQQEWARRFGTALEKARRDEALRRMQREAEGAHTREVTELRVKAFAHGDHRT